ncbi:MAG: alpha/beta hydrolase [Moorea sp. SIO2B7]|nr:alpha/beta hydrolase [Moorena sp. SIO2B7]
MNKELEFYFNAAGLKDKQKEALRKTLLTQYPINGVQLSTFINRPTGETLLERIGILLSVPGGRNGKYILRCALIKAALDSEKGLTLINFLRHLATDIQLNTKEIKQTLDYQKRLSLATDALSQDALKLSSQKIAELNQDYTKIKDIREKGKYGVNPVQILQLTDEKRKRSFNVHIYQPQRWKEGKTPVVVVSHGHCLFTIPYC